MLTTTQTPKAARGAQWCPLVALQQALLHLPSTFEPLVRLSKALLYIHP